jgi:hypothetical protein
MKEFKAEVILNDDGSSSVVFRIDNIDDNLIARMIRDILTEEISKGIMFDANESMAVN